MRSRSLKRERENRQRNAMLRAKYGPDPDAIWCELQLPGCMGRAHDGDEWKSSGRGGSRTDPANVRALCRSCHDLSHRDPDGHRHSWEA